MPLFTSSTCLFNCWLSPTRLRARERERDRQRERDRDRSPGSEGPDYPVQETWITESCWGTWTLRQDQRGFPYWWNEALGIWVYQIEKPSGPLPWALNNYLCSQGFFAPTTTQRTTSLALPAYPQDDDGGTFPQLTE